MNLRRENRSENNVKHKAFWPLVVLAAFAALLLAGCGGGSGTTKTALLQGNAAHRAAALAGYQSFAAGTAYPFTALKLAAPQGSVIQAGAASKAVTDFPSTPLSFAHLLSARSRAATRPTRAATLTFVPALNLYAADAAATANVITLNYYTDAAGTQSAGGITITLPKGSTDTNFTAYPVTVPIVINLTAGNLLCNGTVTVTFTGQTGKNTLTGTLALPRNKIVFTLALALDDTGNVSGSITGQENGATIKLTNCTGPLFGTLNCDLEIDPYGWKGTATGSLTTGQFATSVNTSTGISSSTVDASGNVVLTYPDKTTETVTDPLVATLISSGSTGTGTTGTGTPGTASDAYTIVDLGLAVAPLAVNNAGQVLTGDSTSSFGPINTLYRSSSTATPQPLLGINGYTEAATSLNDSGEVVGGGTAYMASNGGIASTASSSYDWTGPTATPTTFQNDVATNQAIVNRINNKREAVGKGNTGDSTYEALYWKDASSKPVVLPGQTIRLFSGNNFTATDISQDGRIVGIGNGKPFYWQNSTTPPVTLASSGTGTFVLLRVNSKGNIFARVDSGSVSHILYWSSPQAQPQTLPGLSGSTSEQGNFMNENGDIAGSSVTSNGSTAVIWKGGVPQDLNQVATSFTNHSGTWGYVTATAINDKGWIIGTGSHLVDGAVSSQYLSAYLLIPK